MDITTDDVLKVSTSLGLTLSDAQVQEIIKRFDDREWLKTEWIIKDIINEIDNENNN